MLKRAEDTTVEAFLLKPCRGIPNHERFPLLIYRSVFAADTGSMGRVFLALFAENNWTNGWENGVFDFHHYHSNTHEVLGIAGGAGVVLFGGDTGVKVRVEAGDVVLIPVGVGHKALSSEPGFVVVGAYPGGISPDLCRDQGESNHSGALPTEDVPVCREDPLFGKDGLVQAYWMGT